MEHWDLLFDILNKELNPQNNDSISEELWDEICFQMDCIKNEIKGG